MDMANETTRTASKATDSIMLDKASAQRVAMDAILEGRWSEAMVVLGQARDRAWNPITLGRTQAKQVSKILLAQGRVMEAHRVLAKVLRSGAMAELCDAPSATVGDILVSSWGYDQTNIDFYQVVKVSGTRVTIRKIGKNFLPSVNPNSTADAVRPIKGAFVGEPMVKRVQKSSTESYSIKIESFASARPWDGGTHYQTASNCGH